MDNGADSRPPDSLPQKLGLADTVRGKPFCEVGVFFLGQQGFHNAAAVRGIVSLSHGMTSFRLPHSCGGDLSRFSGVLDNRANENRISARFWLAFFLSCYYDTREGFFYPLAAQLFFFPPKIQITRAFLPAYGKIFLLLPTPPRLKICQREKYSLLPTTPEKWKLTVIFKIFSLCFNTDGKKCQK